MQVTTDNAIVERKPQINFSVPGEMRETWDGFSEEFGKRRGSIVGMAALLMFLSAGPAEHEKWIKKVTDAETFGRMKELIRDSRSKAKRAAGRGVDIRLP
jgi:hypothetical protein